MTLTTGNNNKKEQGASAKEAQETYKPVNNFNGDEVKQFLGREEKSASAVPVHKVEDNKGGNASLASSGKGEFLENWKRERDEEILMQVQTGGDSMANGQSFFAELHKQVKALQEKEK
jgi:hypothetical protein